MQRKWIGLLIVLLMAAGLVFLWQTLRRGFSAREEPSALEAMVARAARSFGVPGDIKKAQNPVPLTAETLREGMAHFADHCAVCHGNNGSGNTQFGRNMYPKAPDMRGADTQELTDGELYYVIQNGIRLTGMPAFGGPKDGTGNLASWKLVHFIRHLPKLTPQEEAEMKKMNPVSPHELEEQKEVDEFLEGDKE